MFPVILWLGKIFQFALNLSRPIGLAKGCTWYRAEEKNSGRNL